MKSSRISWTLANILLNFFTLDCMVNLGQGLSATLQESVVSFAANDISDDPYAFETTELPPNPRFYPSVGNGHLAHNVYRDTIYVNGIYNGELGVSHRARIPAYHSSNFSIQQPNCSEATHHHRLDLQNGTFTGTFHFTGVNVTYVVYAHQFYNRLLVTHIHLERDVDCDSECCVGNIIVLREDLGSNETESFNMTEREPYNVMECNNCFKQSGSTVEPEIKDDPLTPVTLYWHEMPSVLELLSNESSRTYTYILSVDQSDTIAKDNFDAALDILQNRGWSELLDNHTASFRSIWLRGRIEVIGDLHLHKVILGSLYYLYTSLPAHPTFLPNNQFYGLSPGGLPNGANHSVHRDYYGHVFWDMETWMYPPILMFRPDLGKDMLSYRIGGMDRAKDRAKDGGYEGARFPWESAFTGIEVTPDICVPCRENQQHITGDIAYAARQYLSVTGDMDWLTNPQADTNYTGLDFILEMGKFWNSRPEFNETSARYDINGVMPPDEHQQSINNSIYTNVIASYSVHYAQYAACYANQSHLLPSNFTHIGQKLKFPFHEELRYHEEFDGYQHTVDTNTTGGIGVGIKQADVVMLGYPFNWEMPDDVRRNDLNIYEEVTHPNGPAMTWGIHAVGWLDLGDKARADQLFHRSYGSYAREPFKVWTEVQSGDGAVNFITGMGGFLQAVVFGYAGLRLEVDEIRCDRAYLMPGTTEFGLYDLDYLGMKYDVNVVGDNLVKINVSQSAPTPLYLHYERGTFPLVNGFVAWIVPPFSIRQSTTSTCTITKPEIDVTYPELITTETTTYTESPSTVTNQISGASNALPKFWIQCFLTLFIVLKFFI